MADSKPRDQAELRITGSETADNSVPLDVLVRTLQGLQQTAVVLEASTDQRPIERRFRPSEEVRRRSELRCGPLTPGSVAVTLSSVTDREESPLHRVLVFTEAVAQGNRDAVRRIIPDSRLRDRALRETLAYLPRSGQRWGIEISNGSLKPIRMSIHTRRTLEDWFRESTVEVPMVVTGELIRIDFAKNRVDIRYPPTKRTLGFNYEVDSEDLLIQSRRSWVQATGQFELDDAGNPIDVIEVTQIEPLDLSPMTFDVVERDGIRLEIDPPLALQPELDHESFQVLVVQDSTLNLHAYAPTREALENEIVQQLFFLWNEYGSENADRLTQGAKDLQTSLRKRIRESTDAA